MVHEAVEPLVHPAVQPLVAPHHHREPGMAELVVGHAVESLGVGAVPAEDDHRVLHPALDPVHVARERVGVRRPLLRVVLERGLGVLGRLLPQRIGGRRVEAHRQGPAAVDADRVPDEVARRGPGEVAHAVGREAPGERGVRRRRARGGIADLVLAADDDRLGRSSAPEPAARAAPRSAPRRGSAACPSPRRACRRAR